MKKRTEEKVDSPRLKTLKHKARRHSIGEGIFCSIKSGLADNYLHAFAISLKASNSSVALMSSIMGIFGPISQYFSSKLIEKKSRKKIILTYVLLEILMFLPLISIALMHIQGIFLGKLPLIFMISFSLYTIFMNLSIPAWFSWVGDIVDEEYRGRWFSKRNLYIGFISMIAIIIGAIILEIFERRQNQMMGYIILFSIAMISRFFSWRLFHKQYEPKLKLKKGDKYPFKEFLMTSPKTNFGKFALFKTTLNFSQTLASSLFSIYILRELGFNYLSYMMIIISTTFFSILSLNLWGKLADKYGNYKIILITCIFIPIIPLLWILNQSLIYILLVPSIISGVFWSGFNLASGNFIYDNVSPQKREIAVSYYNILNGIGISLGGILSAILISSTKFKEIGIEPIIAIFLISGILRMISVSIFLPQIKEVKKKSRRISIKNIIFKETKPAIIEEMHEIMAIKRYIRG